MTAAGEARIDCQLMMLLLQSQAGEGIIHLLLQAGPKKPQLHLPLLVATAEAVPFVVLFVDVVVLFVDVVETGGGGLGEVEAAGGGGLGEA